MSPYGQYPAQPYPPAPPGYPPAPPRRTPVVAIVLIVVAVVLVAGGAVAAAGYVLFRSTTPRGDGEGLDGVHNYLQTNPDWFTRTHRSGPLVYPINPPVGGDHNAIWQNCMGDVYPAEIADEHAVHSLEHGSVWVTYRPDLSTDQVERLAERVRDVEYMLMSPYPGLDVSISLQAWGYQLKVDDARDPRIDEFITAYRRVAAPEPGATCSGGVTEASPVPQDLPGGM